MAAASSAPRDQSKAPERNVLMDTWTPATEKGSLLTCAARVWGRSLVPVTPSPRGERQREGRGDGRKGGNREKIGTGRNEK